MALSDIQLALVNAGLTNQQKVQSINRQKAIDEAYLRVSAKVKQSGQTDRDGIVYYNVDDKTMQRYLSLQQQASKQLRAA